MALPLLVSSVRTWPGLRTEHAWLPFHDRPTTTRPGQIGVAFSGHRRLVYETGGRTVETDHAPGVTIVSGPDPVTWLRVGEHVEALEMYPDPALVAATAAARSIPPGDIEPRIGVLDGTVLAIGTRLSRAHVTGLTDVGASTLAHRLVEHLVDRYAERGAPARRSPAGRLDTAAVDRVAEVVEARLGGVLALEELAAVVRLSPYHFHRCFRATTGLAPHAFVTARRMDRARLMVSTTARPVDEIAASVGFANLSHFRRVFRRHHGRPPSALRTPRTAQEPT